MEPVFYIRHLAGKKLYRAARMSRKVRRMGLILPNGVQIKRRGVRGTPISAEDVEKYQEKIKEWVEAGLAQIIAPDGSVLDILVLEEFAGKYSPVEPEDDGDEEGAEGAEEEDSESEEDDEEGAEDEDDDGPEETPDPGEDADSEGETSEDTQGTTSEEGPTAEEEETSEDSGESSEEEASEGPEEEVYTEKDLKKMRRPELDELAKDQGLDPSKYSNAGLLIEALLGEEE